jgi:hypothetical protein
MNPTLFPYFYNFTLNDFNAISLTDSHLYLQPTVVRKTTGSHRIFLLALRPELMRKIINNTSPAYRNSYHAQRLN